MPDSGSDRGRNSTRTIVATILAGTEWAPAGNPQDATLTAREARDLAVRLRPVLSKLAQQPRTGRRRDLEWLPAVEQLAVDAQYFASWWLPRLEGKSAQSWPSWSADGYADWVKRLDSQRVRTLEIVRGTAPVTKIASVTPLVPKSGPVEELEEADEAVPAASSVAPSVAPSAPLSAVPAAPRHADPDAVEHPAPLEPVGASPSRPAVREANVPRVVSQEPPGPREAREPRGRPMIVPILDDDGPPDPVRGADSDAGPPVFPRPRQNADIGRVVRYILAVVLFGAGLVLVLYATHKKPAATDTAGHQATTTPSSPAAASLQSTAGSAVSAPTASDPATAPSNASQSPSAGASSPKPSPAPKTTPAPATQPSAKPSGTVPPPATSDAGGATAVTGLAVVTLLPDQSGSFTYTAHIRVQTSGSGPVSVTLTVAGSSSSTAPGSVNPQTLTLQLSGKTSYDESRVLDDHQFCPAPYLGVQASAPGVGSTYRSATSAC